MLLLLAATNEGLATAFVGVREPGDLRLLLGIPPEAIPIGIALFGYGAPDKPSRSLRRGRKPLEAVVHQERW
jgi:nitroreductase